MTQEIISPPYPCELTGEVSLVSYFFQLAEWIKHYRKGHNTLVGKEVISLPPRVPTGAFYGTQPIAAKFQHLLTMATIRREWDEMVRLYENDWDNKKAVRMRVLMLQAGVSLLHDINVSREMREAKKVKVFDRIVSALEHINNLFDRTLEKKRAKAKRQRRR
jgi:hypothetical protein